jgi:hypothetical protein
MKTKRFMQMIAVLIFAVPVSAESDSAVIELGSRRELFVDRFLIDTLDNTHLILHHPIQAPISATQPKGGYVTILLDAGQYRMYYRSEIPGYDGKRFDGNPGEITCYAESPNGIDWTLPNLGLYDIGGSKSNNAILVNSAPFSHNFTPWIDTRPGCPADEKYKALAGTHKGGGLFAFVSADGIHWTRPSDKPLITFETLAFDSQNVAFWSETENQYVCYFRSWQTPHGEQRTISRTTSPDFVRWSKAVPMNPNIAGEHLYTSGTHPYFRAPHLLIAPATRFVPDRNSSTEIVLMTSRGGDRFDRTFLETFIRPGLDPKRWQNRANYVAWHIVPTSPQEMSLYIGNLRYTLRTDGFASVNAGYTGGQLTTKPLTFTGPQVWLNYSTSASGSIRIEIQTPDGKPVEGFALKDCPPIVGDAIDQQVRWKDNANVSALAGKPIRMVFELKDADLFSFQFR